MPAFIADGTAAEGFVHYRKNIITRTYKHINCHPTGGGEVSVLCPHRHMRAIYMAGGRLFDRPEDRFWSHLASNPVYGRYQSGVLLFLWVYQIRSHIVAVWRSSINAEYRRGYKHEDGIILSTIDYHFIIVFGPRCSFGEHQYINKLPRCKFPGRG